jgi:hypothetical protein
VRPKRAAEMTRTFRLWGSEVPYRRCTNGDLRLPLTKTYHGCRRSARIGFQGAGEEQLLGCLPKQPFPIVTVQEIQTIAHELE